MYQPITYSLLVEKKACRLQLDLFKEHFGVDEAIPLTSEVVARFGKLFDIKWAARKLLTKNDLVEFKKDAAYAEYYKVTVPAWEEYYKVRTTDALVNYEKVNDTAWTEYRTVMALAFVEIYKRGLKE